MERGLTHFFGLVTSKVYLPVLANATNIWARERKGDWMMMIFVRMDLQNKVIFLAPIENTLLNSFHKKHRPPHL